MKRHSGFSIIELMVAIAVLGLLMGIGVPALQTFILNNRLTSQLNQLSTSLALARSEAVKLNRRVVVCVSTDGADCAAPGSGETWNKGWLVFVDRDNDSEVDGGNDCAANATDDCILSIQAAYPGENVLTPTADVADFLIYVGDGSLRCDTDNNPAELETCSNATYFTLCDFRLDEHAKALEISRTGRVSIMSKKPNGGDLECT